MSFDGKCKYCKTQMDTLQEEEWHGSLYGGCDYLLWCPKCGSVVDYSVSYKSPTGTRYEWRHPGGEPKENEGARKAREAQEQIRKTQELNRMLENLGVLVKPDRK